MSASFTSRNPVGPLLWVLSIQYYVVQVLVAVAWSQSAGYSWASNTISDLGNTQCAIYGGRLVCSPWHLLMNASFIVLGLTMLIGALLLNAQLSKRRLNTIGFWCFAAAGIGTIMVGLFPENTISISHVIGAALPFVLGNVGMIILGSSLPSLPTPLRVFTVFCGSLGLAALLLFMTQTYLGVGIGGMERIVSYPQSIWMIVFGVYLLLHKPRD